MKYSYLSNLAMGFWLGAVVASPALGDAIKVSGIWIDGVTVEAISEGMVDYITPGGSELSESLTLVEGIRMSAFPKLGQALDAIEQNNYADAQALLVAVLGQVKKPWLRSYTNWHLLEVYQRLDDPGKAVNVYMALVKADAQRLYLQKPPVDSVLRGADEVKAAIARLLEPVVQRADPQIKPLLEQLLVAAQQAAPANVSEDALTAYEHPREADAFLLPKNLPDSPVADLLRDARFNEALTLADQQLLSSGRLSEKLYLKAMAHLALADRDGDAGSYKDAGISFMRVIVYFPRSRYVGPALVELGYVHAKIDRPDLARKLYDRAGIMVDEQEDPNYYQRLLKLLGDLPATLLPRT